MEQWDTEVDIVVVGSGGGGMTAAIVAANKGASALVIEKAEYYGGTTALSGGVIWVPNNHLMQTQDSEAQAQQYLQQVTAGEVAPKRLQAYIQNSPKMVRCMEDMGIRYESAPLYMDYYPDLDGGKLGGRSLDPVPFSRRKLGKIAAQLLAQTHGAALSRFSMTAKEAHLVLAFNWKTKLFFLWRMMLYYLDIPSRVKRLPDNRMTLGQALVGRLRFAMLKKNIPLMLNTQVTELITDNGKVVGVLAQSGDKLLRIKASKAVVLAAGGFAKNTAMRQQYQQQPINSEWTAASDYDTGDGIKMGQAVGADAEFMHCAWWTPTLKLPDNTIQALIIGKSMPGCIFVGKNGKRFTNEAAPYEDVIKGQYAANNEQRPTIPAYMIFDARFRSSYPCGPIGPSTVQPDALLPQMYKDTNYFNRADTLDELANNIGIDAHGLQETILRVNGFAITGKDEDFGRGDSLQDRYYSDPTIKPNPTLAAIEKAPFYAIEVYPGDLGTKGGLRCNEHAQVINTEGDIIEGLYATGNCSSSVMGNSYPGAGSTIGASMTFGYIAAVHALAQ